jgi:hypothetical protein
MRKVCVTMVPLVVLGLSACVTGDPAASSQPADTHAPASGNDAAMVGVARIRGQNHQALPAAQAYSSIGGGPSKITVQNPTAFALTVYLVGPVTSSFSIPQFASRTVDFPPGSYELAAETSKPAVLPLYGQLTSSAGKQYTETFFSR